MPDSVDARPAALEAFARAALLGVTPASTFAELTRVIDEGEGMTSYRFATTLSGYPGWEWNVTIAQLEGSEPTVVESELVPAEGALLAPDWIPWSERMEDYRAAQLALGEAAVLDDSDDDDSDDDESDDDDDESDDDDDDDVFGSDVLHGGDLDGVDIDELDDRDELDDIDSPALDDVNVNVDENIDLLELTVPSVRVHKADQAESDAGGAGEEPPRAPARRQRARKEQQKNDEAD